MGPADPVTHGASHVTIRDMITRRPSAFDHLTTAAGPAEASRAIPRQVSNPSSGNLVVQSVPEAVVLRSPITRQEGLAMITVPESAREATSATREDPPVPVTIGAFASQVGTVSRTVVERTNAATKTALVIEPLKEICPRGNNKVIIYFLIS